MGTLRHLRKPGMTSYVYGLHRKLQTQPTCQARGLKRAELARTRSSLQQLVLSGTPLLPLHGCHERLAICGNYQQPSDLHCNPRLSLFPRYLSAQHCNDAAFHPYTLILLFIVDLNEEVASFDTRNGIFLIRSLSLVQLFADLLMRQCPAFAAEYQGAILHEM